MNAKESIAGLAVGVLLGAGGSQMVAPERIDLKELGPDRVWEQDYNGTDGSDPDKVWFLSRKVNPDGSIETLIVPKSMVKEVK